ncbi:MAG TPA: LLM class F420-dependent oxidoreductase [Acidimicrobiia bacterium]|nr:LLM class F420-dependent oxidoreductase [Acidimicrobiia bacterium]
MTDGTVALGVLLPMAPGQTTSGNFLREWAGVVEECGVESVWGVEHVVVAHDYDPKYPYSDDGQIPGATGGAAGALSMPDPLETLAFVAAVSRSVNLGTAVVIAPLHSPAVLAKRVSTIDNLSGGRVLLGLGIGWQREEYGAVGVPFRDRGTRLEECIGAMRALWTEAPATFHGEHFAFDRVYSSPRPARGPVPIVLGGNSAPAVERVGRIGDGWFPFTIGPDEFAASVRRLREVAAATGRDPDAIEITAWPGSHDASSELDVDYVRRFVAAGARRVLISPYVSRGGGFRGLREQIHAYRDGVLEKV